MAATKKISILCISSFFKGGKFIEACKASGATVYLLTSTKLKGEDWPFQSIDECFYLEADSKDNWNMEHATNGLAYIMRQKQIDRIVALDDFDVEKAAQLREHFRIPGMGQTTARYFRDKLAMRIKAKSEGIQVPAFSPLFNDAQIHAYTQDVPAPWLVKPRSEASATGITKIHDAASLWQHLEKLGENRHHYLIEKFEPGAVYHVDALSQDGELLFCRVSQYLDTPFEVAHGGGIFRSHIVTFGGEDDLALQDRTAKVMKAFGMNYSASHTEFIKSHKDGKFYFLETASRVGGAHLAEMVEASSGISLWSEWAKIELAQAKGKTYQLPAIDRNYTGIVVSLARDKHPSMSSFTDKEIWWTLNMDYHIGMIVKATNRNRVLELLDNYTQRIHKDFHASAPALEQSSH